MTELVRGGLLFLGLWLQEVGYAFLKRELSNQSIKIDDTADLLLHGGFIVVIAVVLIFIDRWLGQPHAWAWLRRQLFVQARLEGVWVQRLDNEDREFGIGIIRFTRNSERPWCYEGVGFSPGFTPAAEWFTESLHFGAASDRPEWSFSGEGWLLTRVRATGFYKEEPRGRVFVNLRALKLKNDTINPDAIDAEAVDVDVEQKISPDRYSAKVFRPRLTRLQSRPLREFTMKYKNDLGSRDQIRSLRSDEVRVLHDMFYSAAAHPSPGVVP